MGTTLSSVMQKSNSFKYLWSKEKKVSAGKFVANASTIKSDLPSCSYHQDDDISNSFHSRDQCKLDSDHLKSSKSDLLTVESEPTTTSCNVKLDDIETIVHRKAACSPNYDYADIHTKRTSDKDRQHIKPFKQANNDRHYLHKCSSEPLVQPVTMHRTSSDIPQHLASKKNQNSKYISGQIGCIKHMEGLNHSIKNTSYQIDDTKPVEIAQLSMDESQKSDGSWVTTSSSDDSTISTSIVREAVLKIQQPHIERLIQHMEYVVTVMKKRMNSMVYNHNKALFLSKIISSHHIQYGYQNDTYIKIGSGEFGEVLYGRMKDNGQLVAIKGLKRDKTDVFALLQEAFMLQVASDTEYAPKYIGLAPFTLLGDMFQEWSIVLEFIGSSQGPSPFDFRQTLKLAKASPRTTQLLLEWIYTSAKIAQAVNRFHAIGMLLNDIKADNILLKPIGNGYHPVFVDFGLASIGEGITLALEVNDKNRAKILKEYSHIAPEVLFGGETNIKSDIFSLGKALSLIGEAFQNEPLTNIINQCTLWNVAERPSVEQLIEGFQWLSNNIAHHR